MHASYLQNSFNRKEQDKTIVMVRDLIKERQLKFDNFIVTGVSGITMGAIMARELNKGLTIVRKVSDNSHSSYNVENFQWDKSYIFLDDLIASGNTYKNVTNSFKCCLDKRWLYGDGKRSKIIGSIFYYVGYLDRAEFWTNQKVGKYIKNR
jgi:phosphoribosylpyrophosphate synthetase